MSFKINKYFYGDIPEEKAGSSNYETKPDVANWPLWEVFIRSKQGLDHKHAGSLHAADATMAIENARDVLTLQKIKCTGTLLFTIYPMQ